MSAEAWRTVGFWVAVMLAAYTAGIFAGIAVGQESETDTLARCLMGEAGDNARDHAAQLHVHQKRARWSGRTLVEQALEYANGCKAARVDLDRAKFPEIWEATRERVEAFRRGELPDPCRGRATHWGGTVKGTEKDQERIAACLAAGTCEVVDCGKTKNTFFRTVKHR